MALYKIDKVLLQRELFKGTVEVNEHAPTPKGEKKKKKGARNIMMWTLQHLILQTMMILVMWQIRRAGEAGVGDSYGAVTGSFGGIRGYKYDEKDDMMKKMIWVTVYLEKERRYSRI
ncbi:hypothetical protein L6452_03501 [Arctium lappa]|uniref:Uncharacterized protein n=1 Tax=Arctium lappa TaxID=4217 RepID=A0ACB9FM20_ARCLA|nr:hypothetical protein L6452_03501 [Arctium lappa]